MKTLTVILFVAILMLQSFGTVILLAGFEMNRDVITTAFCINKDKPEMQCNGKCHLNKTLQKNDTNERSGITHKLKWEWQMQVEAALFSAQKLQIENSLATGILHTIHPKPFTDGLLRPPQV